MNVSKLTSEDSSYDGFNYEEYKNYQITIDDSFIANMKRAMKEALVGNPADRQKQKIRKELVRDYIHNKEKQPAAIRRVLRDLFESWYY